MTRVGLTDWVVATPEHFVSFAKNLENDLDHLAQLRAGLRQRMIDTLCDAERFTCGLEVAYSTMWRRWSKHGERSGGRRHVDEVTNA